MDRSICERKKRKEKINKTCSRELTLHILQDHTPSAFSRSPLLLPQSLSFQLFLLLKETLLLQQGMAYRMRAAENMADMGARVNLQLTATGPDAKGQLQILAAPATHAHIVLAQVLPEVAVDGKEAASHSRTGHGISRSAASCKRAINPSEVQGPMKATDGHAAAIVVVQGAIANGVDDRANNVALILTDARQQRFSPASTGFAVTVQKYKDLTLGVGGTQRPGSNQAYDSNNDTRKHVRTPPIHMHR